MIFSRPGLNACQRYSHAILKPEDLLTIRVNIQYAVTILFQPGIV
ncbi:hypothetical protein EAMG_05564, partial [Escherichia coli M056]